jgi:hypothetical protein
MQRLTIRRAHQLALLAMLVAQTASAQAGPGAPAPPEKLKPPSANQRGMGTRNPIGPDQAFSFDYDGTGKPDHLVLYRPGAGAISILKRSGDGFAVVYRQNGTDGGIGNCDLKSRSDHMFAMDYEGSGKLDHIVLYRPGTGAISILKHTAEGFTTVYRQEDTAGGIGGYDLRSKADRGLALDLGGAGKQDHLVFLRAGAGAIGILKRAGNGFEAVYQQPDPGKGIGTFDLGGINDRGFAFDYDGSGKLDHLVLYRPGSSTVSILKHAGQGFKEVYRQDDSAREIGGFALGSTDDRAFAFDYNGSGKQDHLVFYRAGTGAVAILKRTGKGFEAVYCQRDPGLGIGDFDLASTDDRAFAFDYDGSGKQDHLVLYRPGGGAISILKHAKEGFIAVYRQGDNGSGIGGYDLKSSGH